MLLLKDFTAFFFNSCETIHVMNTDHSKKFDLESFFFRQGCLKFELFYRTIQNVQ